MFDHHDSVIGLSELGVSSGESHEERRADQSAYELTCREMADGWVESERHLLPGDLEDLLPGPYLAVIVSSIDPSRMNGHDVVRLMQAESRLVSHHEARKHAAMAETAFAFGPDPDCAVLRSSEQVEYAAVEIAAALTLTRRASEDQLGRAVVMSSTLSRVRQALSDGLIDMAKTRVFDQLLGHLPQETVDTVLDQVLSDAGDLTTGQLRARVARLVLEADPDGSKSSYQRGIEERRVTTRANPDLTANFTIGSADPVAVAAARRHVEEMARHIRSISGEGRTLDQIRADVALDLLQGKCNRHPHHSSSGTVHVTVSAETLAGLSDAPADLEGFGPVIAEIARKTVRENIDGEWTFTVTDQGRPVATGTLSRRPTAAQKRQIQAVYPTCVMVGCRQPAYHCDLDHRRPHSQGGSTNNDNLEPLCRHHHMVRHHARWQLERFPNGDHQWTSPLGHTYVRRRGPPD